MSENDATLQQIDQFLLYAATFLSNVGNYYVRRYLHNFRSPVSHTFIQGFGDQKFIPGISKEFFVRLSSRSSKLKAIYDTIAIPLFSIPPFKLDYPSESAQSAYYLGSMTPDEIKFVSKALESYGVSPENTRVKKGSLDGTTYEILQASAETSTPDFSLGGQFKLRRGDHCDDLRKICTNLSTALTHATDPAQRKYLEHLIKSFQTGRLEEYRLSQQSWVGHKAPQIETVFGFVEPYRDPHGIRAEFEGFVGINGKVDEPLAALVQAANIVIKKLPWVPEENQSGVGPFEKAHFEAPKVFNLHCELPKLSLF